MFKKTNLRYKTCNKNELYFTIHAKNAFRSTETKHKVYISFIFATVFYMQKTIKSLRKSFSLLTKKH